MARKVFHSFHFDRDAWRVSQVRNIGAIEGQPLLSANDWEAVKRGGSTAIQGWINQQMSGTSCVIVLIGRETAGRRWVEYEIEKGWNEKRGLVGVHIHRLKDRVGGQDGKGPNPFSGFTVNGTDLSSIVPTYDPPYSDSTLVYAHIKENLESWVETGIAVRNRF